MKGFNLDFFVESEKARRILMGIRNLPEGVFSICNDDRLDFQDGKIRELKGDEVGYSDKAYPSIILYPKSGIVDCINVPEGSSNIGVRKGVVCFQYKDFDYMMWMRRPSDAEISKSELD